MDPLTWQIVCFTALHAPVYKLQRDTALCALPREAAGKSSNLNLCSSRCSLTYLTTKLLTTSVWSPNSQFLTRVLCRSINLSFALTNLIQMVNRTDFRRYVNVSVSEKFKNSNYHNILYFSLTDIAI